MCYNGQMANNQSESQYEESVKKIQNQALADLNALLAEPDPKVLQANKTEFLVQLIEARRKLHLTQTQLAEKLSMQQSAIARIESGRANPSLNTLLQITEVLRTKLTLR